MPALFYVTWIMMLTADIACRKKKSDISFILTYLWDRIFIFLFVALCLLASLTDLFVCLHHH